MKRNFPFFKKLARTLLEDVAIDKVSEVDKRVLSSSYPLLPAATRWVSTLS
jgi:hypothetical protein